MYQNCLVMGSCRVYVPTLPLGVFRYPGGMVHTPKMLLQDIRIAKGLIKVVDDVASVAFRVSRIKDVQESDLVFDILAFDYYILELSSVVDYCKGGIYYLTTGLSSDLSGFEVVKSGFEETLCDLNNILEELGPKPILFLQHKNTNKLQDWDRYSLGFALSEIERTHKNVKFVDLSNVVAQYGFEKTMDDSNHFTEFMRNQVLEIIKSFLGEHSDDQR